MNRLTIEQLNAIRERAEKATAGPWEYYEVNGGYTVELNDRGEAILSYYDRSEAVSNAEFIANARQDIPALLAEVDRLKKKFAEISELSEIFYEVDYTGEDGIVYMKLRSDFEKYRDFVREIFVLSSEEVDENGEEI
jgi:hypothetical protein